MKPVLTLNTQPTILCAEVCSSFIVFSVQCQAFSDEEDSCGCKTLQQCRNKQPLGLEKSAKHSPSSVWNRGIPQKDPQFTRRGLDEMERVRGARETAHALVGFSFFSVLVKLSLLIYAASYQTSGHFTPLL